MSKLAKAQQIVGDWPIRYKTVGSKENPALMMQIDYEQAPVPAHYYTADYFQLEPLETQVLIIFGKLDHPQKDRLRNKIEIYFPADAFVQQLWKSSRDFEKSLAGFIDKAKTQIVGPSSFPPVTDKVQTLQSNNVLMVLSTNQTMMDFFYISVKDLWLRPQRNQPIGMEALVRVMCEPPMLMGFLQEASKIVDRYKGRFGIEESEIQHETLEFK